MTYVEAALAKRAEIDAANALLTDEQALNNKGVYRTWDKLVKYAVTVPAGYRFRHNGSLYKTRQPEYTFVETWVPGTPGTESLFGVIDESHAGTLNDPIPYNRNMELREGLYYIEDGVVYYCYRNTGQEVYSPLSALVEIYVNVVEVV